MRRSLPECLPDGRTGFTRYPGRASPPASAGACRSACLTVEPASPVPWPCQSARERRSLPECLPDGRTGFTRYPGRAGAPAKRRSLPECLPDGRTGFTRYPGRAGAPAKRRSLPECLPVEPGSPATLAVPERPPSAGACRSACLPVEPASPAPWLCRSARES